eukprot:TRINITY_DN18528_c0_g1_i1.p1 TRINITY_DN18528_c0_g1~~TRINITY_DN18528_c0_g1_i1.p1  ORF type:complete len:177 (+),score=27.90 TRINITY_DN18528_c0_g1_i1:52-531(+)
MKSAVLDGPGSDKRRGVAMSPLGRAVLEWILSLPGRPIVKQGVVEGGLSRNIDEVLIMCYSKEITKDGLQAFGDLSDKVSTFFELQKVMTKRLMTTEIPKPIDRKLILKKKLETANALWNATHPTPSLSSSAESVSPLSSPASDVLAPPYTRRVTFELQ